MAVTSTITQNIPSGSLQVVFNNPTEFENITYNSSGITYAIESSVTLSKADFATFYANKLAFYNALLLQFPTLIANNRVPLPVATTQIQSLSVPNSVTYVKTSGGQPVYTMTYTRSTDTMVFSARSNAITITPQEYLFSFQMITQFSNQVAIS